MHHEGRGKCRCPHHFIIPLLVIAIAVVILLRNLDMLNMHTADIIWPIFLGVGGLQLFIQRCCRCCSSQCVRGECQSETK